MAKIEAEKELFSIKALPRLPDGRKATGVELDNGPDRQLLEGIQFLTAG